MTDPRPRDDCDAAQDITRDPADITAHIGQLKGDADAYLTDLNYGTLRLRLELSQVAVEAVMGEVLGGNGPLLRPYNQLRSPAFSPLWLAGAFSSEARGRSAKPHAA
jgi:hypothetical protein